MHDDEMKNMLKVQYDQRFSANKNYRNLVWKELCLYFARYIHPKTTVLDLGCGWGEFINNVVATEKIGMDLNPDSQAHLNADVKFLNVDCASPWPLDSCSLDVVFSSNFLEHLPQKSSVELAVSEAYRCLRPDGKLIVIGPNIKYTRGAYWDFWDHHLPFTELSIAELIRVKGFGVEKIVPQFIPYSMSNERQIPRFWVALYLKFSLIWPLWGKQFFVIGVKPEAADREL